MSVPAGEASVVARAPQFAGVGRRPGNAGRRSTYLAASLLAQAALVGLVWQLPGPARDLEVQILPPVAVKRPGPAAAPGPPPPAPPAAPKRRTPAAPVAKPLVAPEVVPERPPDPAPLEPEEEAGDAGEVGGEVGGVPGGTGEGVVGGVPGGGGGTPEPIPARPADLAMVKERIARTLTYPPRAKRMGWVGRVELAFVLTADGRVRDLRVARTSGYSELDDAALAAVERAAPFPPPGLLVRLEIPVNFQLR